jgi:nitrite reductase/ring-hydroxylating ferredoxin subunit
MPEYVKVAQASELEPNHGKLVEVQGKKIALFNLDGKFHAIDNTCTHRGGPLSEGELEGDEVTCPWHGANSRLAPARCSARRRRKGWVPTKSV